MSLPELGWQIIYGRLAWAIVLAALITTLWPRSWLLSRRAVIFLLVGTAALQMLPEEASMAYWLGLTFQWPSGVFVALCLVKLHSASRGGPREATIAPGLATILALTGGVLYLDAIGWVSYGLYYWGFTPIGAPLLALLVAVACSVVAVRSHARSQAFALLAAVTVFSLLRLPTGNVWDALLDPLLWGWSLVSLLSVCWQRQLWRRPRMHEHASLS